MTDENEAPESVATSQVHAELYTWLRTNKPPGVVIVTKEGKRQPIALRTGKSRWTIATRVVVRMLDDVDRVEIVDKRGATLDTWTPTKSRAVTDAGDDDAAAELAGLAGLGGKGAAVSIGSADVNLAFAAQVVKLVQIATDHAIDRHDRSTREAYSVITEQHRIITARVGELERTLGSTLKAIYDATKTRAEVEGWAASATKELARRERDLDKREERLGQGGEGAELANLDGLAIEFMRSKGILPPLPGKPAPATSGHDSDDTKPISEDDL